MLYLKCLKQVWLTWIGFVWWNKGFDYKKRKSLKCIKNIEIDDEDNFKRIEWALEIKNRTLVQNLENQLLIRNNGGIKGNIEPTIRNQFARFDTVYFMVITNSLILCHNNNY